MPAKTPPGNSLSLIALRLLVRLAVFGIIAALALWGLDWLRAHTDGPAAGMTALAVLLVIYALLLAVPFMPGIEIGLSLLMLKGADAAPFVWGATVVGLSLAWTAGRWLPGGWISATLRDLRLTAFADTIDRLGEQPPELRLRFVCFRAPGWLAPIIRDWRYVALALLLNLPGNVLLGGGGGLALLAGLSRIFTWPAVLLAFVIGTAPIPLLVWVAGSEVLPWTH
jgi:hypothetical protein